jgi:alpha-1,3-mannosyl-glycoprotein beta-1,2-N-acetylglucosaminyltransferase
MECAHTWHDFCRWMMRVDVWNELNVKWPEAYWDDWLRMPEQRKGRACIRPEVPRTAMSAFGKVGVSRYAHVSLYASATFPGLGLVHLFSDSLAFFGCSANMHSTCRGLYFEKHLKHIALNKQFVPFTARDLTYLVKDEYDRAFAEQVCFALCSREHIVNRYTNGRQSLNRNCATTNSRTAARCRLLYG